MIVFLGVDLELDDVDVLSRTFLALWSLFVEECPLSFLLLVKLKLFDMILLFIFLFWNNHQIEKSLQTKNY